MISNRTVRLLSACAIAVGAFTVPAGPASASGGADHDSLIVSAKSLDGQCTTS